MTVPRGGYYAPQCLSCPRMSSVLLRTKVENLILIIYICWDQLNSQDVPWRWEQLVPCDVYCLLWTLSLFPQFVQMSIFKVLNEGKTRIGLFSTFLQSKLTIANCKAVWGAPSPAWSGEWHFVSWKELQHFVGILNLLMEFHTIH